MRGSIWFMVPLAGLVGGALASAAGEPARPWFVASVGIFTACEVYVARMALERTEAGAYRRWRRAELFVLAVVMRIAQAITGGAGGVLDPTWGDWETLMSLLVLILIRSAVNATVDDLDALEGALQRPDGTDPITRIRGRVLGYLTLVAISAGYAAVGMRGVFDLARDPARQMQWTPLLFLACALPGVAYASLRAESGRWRRDGAVIDDAIGQAWMRRATAVAVIVVLVVVATWNVAGVSGVGAAGLVRSGPVGEWIAERLNAIGDREVGSPAERGEGDVIDPVSELDSDRTAAPEWLGELLFLGVATTLVWWAGVRGRRAGDLRRERRGGVRSLSARRVLAELWNMLKELFGGLRRVLGRAGGAGRSGEPAGRVHRSPSAPWSSDDPLRNRIARSYRRGSKEVAASSGVRRRSETLSEFASRVGDELPAQASDLSDLTTSYEEARFSDHRLAEERATQAERAADRVERRSKEDPANG